MLFCELIIRGISEEIFKTLDTYLYIKIKGFNWAKCGGLCTDGAICDKNSNVVTRMFEALE